MADVDRNAIKAAAEKYKNWGKWGPNDEIGTLNFTTPEDIIKFRPDLILTGDFSLAVTRRLAHAVGAPLVEVKSTRTFDDVRHNLRQVGAAVEQGADHQQ